MALDKAIKYGKEKRKEYRGSARWDCTCRNHGSCSYCLSNRTIQTKRAKDKANIEEQIDEYVDIVIGANDPIDALMDYHDEVLEKFGIDPWDFETRKILDI